uniref:Uncharacterized protein n=1 Tax=Arundo donax TaxID=35708 RepID=A0A0A9F915_ARUDO
MDRSGATAPGGSTQLGH